MSIAVSVQIREPTEGEVRAQALLKEATAKHDSKDLLGAIACLFKAPGFLTDRRSVILSVFSGKTLTGTMTRSWMQKETCQTKS